ncbi:thioredoxin family protein [Paenibacillus sp. FSL M8-0334]|uniref:thioredoxin family protein n=1 Tax=Paenibacillus sp. FSL M8-0334 TaxID=2921623 RepID=UPI0030FAD5AB
MIAVTERELLERIEWQERLAGRDSEAASPLIVFLYTPLCGTCSAARRMLEVVEQLLPDAAVLEADVNFMPNVVDKYRVRSVPGLMAVSGRLEQPQFLYRMGSVQDILSFIKGAMA